MITFEEALQLVLRHLATIEAESRGIADLRKGLTSSERKVLGFGSPEDDALKLTILEKETIEGDFGWVFFYQSKKFIESGDYAYALGGNAPLLVSRQDGKLHTTGTAHPIETYINNFRRSGDPHKM